MVMADGGYGVWAVRLEQACEELLPEARWLQADVGGPVDAVRRMAASGVWGGPFADELQGALRWVDGDIVGWGQHLGHLHRALDEAAREADGTARLEAAGIVPSFDLPGALAPWHRWPAASSPLPMDWAGGGAWRGAVVWVEPDGARQLAEGIHSTADQLRGAQRRVATALSTVGIDTPPFLAPVTDGLEEIAGEINRRVTLLENVDRELAGAFRDLGAHLGFPGRLAPPSTFDPADPLDSAWAGLAPPSGAGPGAQPTQVKEADPVSTSTGNFFYQAMDLSQPSRGLPTFFARTYNSLRAGVDGPLGFGWAHFLGTRLVFDATGISVVWGDGHEERYDAAGEVLRARAGGHDRLRRADDGFELITRARVVHRFAADGRLRAVVDTAGNRNVLDHVDGHLVRLTDASENLTTFDHDGAGRITAVIGVLDRRWSYAYSRAGDLEGVTDPEGGVTTYGYDAGHRLVSITDPEGRTVVRNTYDRDGRVVLQEDGAGGRWRYAYQPGVTTVTDPLGHRRTFQFDERFRTTAVTDALGASTRMAWDEASNLVAAHDPTGRSLRFAYNPAGDLTAVEGTGTAPVRFEWDAAGNLTALVSAEADRAEFTWDEAGRPLQLLSPAGVTTRIAWRDDGLPESVSNGDGGTTRYTFEETGRLTSISDPLGAVTTVEVDAAGRPVAEAHPGGDEMTFGWDRCDRLVGVTDAAGATTRYDYDRSGLLSSVTDPLGRITRYRYDPLGLLASVADPLGRETSFSYDACGRLLARTDARDETASFSYDPAGRLIEIAADDGALVTYGWDAAGRLLSTTDEHGQRTSWELDDAARPVIEHGPDGIDILHAFDTLGRRRRLGLHREGTLIGAWEFGFDADGRITTVLDPADRSTVLGYDAAGRLASLNHPNGVTSRWTHDLAGQPIAISHTGPSHDTLSSWQNTFDGEGNLVRSERRLDNDDDALVSVFAYDHLARLTSIETGDGPIAFSWDHASNRTAVERPSSVTSARHDDADQLAASGSVTYRYDSAGNLIERTGGGNPGLACEYDPLGRLTQLRVDSDIVAFGYDALGRRVTRTDAAGTTRRIFDGINLIAELGPSGDIALETTAGLLVLHRHDPGGRSYLHADGNGNAGAVTDDTGAVVAQHAYSAFGLPVALSGRPEAGGPLGFGGALGVRQEAGGLLDMRARFYDPDLGRFTTPDPWPAYLPEPVTLNRYLYALGDPISQVDPLGLFCWTGKNKHGKCRGVRDVADVIDEPLSTVSKVAGGVAVIAAGVTAVCPFPCGVVTVPIAGVAGDVSFYSGLAAGGAHCVAEGITTFDCAASTASAAISVVARPLFRTGAKSVEPLSEGLARMIRFGGGVFGLFRSGATTAAGRTRK